MTGVRFENDLPGRPLGTEPVDDSEADAIDEGAAPDLSEAPPGVASAQAPDLPPAAASSPAGEEPEPDVEGPALTDEESATISATLYAPTVRRMCVLARHIVQITGNGDLAFWAPLAVMDTVLHELHWDSQQPMVAERLLLLMILTLREYATRLNTHLLAVTQWRGAGSRGPSPEMPVWKSDDTRAVYANVAATFGDIPMPSALPPDPEILETMQALAGAHAFLPSSLRGDPPTIEAVVTGWTLTQRRQARAWALKAQLAQLQGNDVVTPPEFLQ